MPSALCRIIAPYVRRERGEVDRRAWQLKLSDRLEAILPSLRRAADLTHERLWAGISGEEKPSWCSSWVE